MMIVGNLVVGLFGSWGITYLSRGLILSAAFLGFLLYVRHHDGHFWQEEEERKRKRKRKRKSKRKRPRGPIGTGGRGHSDPGETAAID
ncbi:hypothetical protein QNO08_09995 [Arthrobacter sp. zg-Y820]|uniref:hypothetical protein n=1 Tax=unclassified Arthrobacter TaxID=235627 RepID=UPI001E45DE11|nr:MULTISPECIES: hypothetical protein [unclassified Arthrobacter]MCC9196549.1 hypothetical protein [Arthrobacter sp. zg-Y820]MDK1279411.1 hypothetical protein [Arthrobacter sp. zg.Y820]WIB08208.1 hypothetical protein QNO08_09995 [Arthrobacter sp. zg-Y820]